MTLEIEGKEYTFLFGIAFIRYFDNLHVTKQGELGEFGVGLDYILVQLFSFHAPTLADVLYVASLTEKQKPGKDKIERYVEENENIEALFDEVISSLKKSAVCSKKTCTMEENLKRNLNSENTL